MALNHKQMLFIAEYLIDFNATRAALDAGYSPKTAHIIGFENLRKPKIQAALEAAIEARMERLHMTQDDVLTELALLGKSSIEHYVIDDMGNLTLAEGAPEGAMRAVTSVKRRITTDSEGNMTVHVEFRLWDKVGSLHLMARHLGMLHDKIEHSGKIEGDLSGKSVEELRKIADDYRRQREERHANGTPDAPG
jgi:phage terminase small subunit